MELIVAEQEVKIGGLESDVKVLSKSVLEVRVALETSQTEILNFGPSLARRAHVKAGDERLNRLEQLMQPRLAVAALFANAAAPKPGTDPSESEVPEVATSNAVRTAVVEDRDPVSINGSRDAVTEASVAAEIALAALAEPDRPPTRAIILLATPKSQLRRQQIPRTTAQERIHQTSVTSHRYSMSFHTAVGDHSHVETIESRTEGIMTVAPQDAETIAVSRSPLDAYKAGQLGSPESTRKPGFFKSFTKAAGKRTVLVSPSRPRKKTRKALGAEEERRVRFARHLDDQDEIQFDTDTIHVMPRTKVEPKIVAKAVTHAKTPAPKEKGSS
ncbi:hypothetical protein LTR95_004059 [Oleoguttula sp. CCFEE 5521]